MQTVMFLKQHKGHYCMISIILLEPAIEGNIGAIARVMANFGFKDLVLVRPKCDHLSQESQGRAKRARPILKKAKVVKDLKGFDYLVATTSQIGSDLNIQRTPIRPSELPELIKGKKTKLGIVFGPEGPGLTNKEVQKCDFVVTIPTNQKYHSMNLSHSVAIVLYEIYQALKRPGIYTRIRPITITEKKQILKMIEEIIKKQDYISETRRDVQRTLWKRIIGKLFMSKRESYALMGFLRKVLK